MLAYKSVPSRTAFHVERDEDCRSIWEHPTVQMYDPWGLGSGQSERTTQVTRASAPTLSSEPTAPIEDGWLDTASGAAVSTAIEPNTSLILCEARDSRVPDSYSPFGDILNSLKSLSLSGNS